MIETLKKIFGIGPSPDFATLVKQGAIILDVRTKGEYAGGHIRGSLNIAVDQLASSLDRLPDKTKPIITCCASGMRSGVAKSVLTAKGYSNVFNGGIWDRLQNKL
ncbi:rhodanese-like domain-containing protein [Chryseolinea lacunae]|uniref:Rhodanese-like domain-containing protein n=1 Tax=Chryseolinea lacunae TaxID=2801331 RepID=A0ABS1KNA2_9BACT|nr:rhodanese-like domain-containing protein [Chryseolinea lacunae]MBL0740958.1 rhodanese-like domain-containing protein [Chryseolinea lacunae]